LLVVVLACVFLSTKVWLQPPEFIVKGLESGVKTEEQPVLSTDIWTVLRPLKAIVKYQDNYTVLYSEKDYNLWNKSVGLIYDALKNYVGSSVTFDAAFPADYLKFDFASEIPIEIFTGQMELDDENLNNSIKRIKNIIIDLSDSKSIYIYNGENTIRITNSYIDTKALADSVKEIDFSRYTKYSLSEKIGNETVMIPVPLEETALNPVFVHSELDIFDTAKINEIARKYFKSNYDYVRKSVEKSGNLVYMYRTEQALKINEEGFLDFFDANIDTNSKSNIYESFISAIAFSQEFMGFPKDGYLSNVKSIQYDGNYGYGFTFSYNILERPILFSKVRANAALEVDVIGNSVVSYKRFIRNIDQSQGDKMQTVNILPAAQVISLNIQPQKAVSGMPELRPLTTDMIKDISNIYLAYFDLSRISKEQVLRVVWVVDIKDKSYIFNAITGALIEEW
jgi:hypothetical protein